MSARIASPHADRSAPLSRQRRRCTLSPVAAHDPVCLYLETTNRCNLLCTTCPRTYADLEPEADMSWELFTRIVDQVPNIARVVLHGVGEPMLVKELPRMVRYLKARGAYVLFNTNGTVLTARKGRELADTRPRRAARLARRRRRPHVPARARQGLFQPHRAQRARLHRDAGARGARPPARLAVADRPQGDRRPAPRFRAHRPRHRRQGGLPAAARVLRPGRDRHGPPGSGPVRAADARGAAASRCGRSAGEVARHQLQRLGRHRARREPRAQGRQEPVVAVPPAVER